MSDSGTGSTSLAGQTLGPYELCEKLGDGEFGPVYLARHTASCREAAVEILRAKSSVDPDRLRQEVNAASALEHWNIGKVFEFVTAGDLSFVARERTPGRTLEEFLRDSAMAPSAAFECARQIAGALAAGHAIGVTHRHLNVSNIVIDAQNRVRLVSFGLSVPAPDKSTLAPEQIDGRGADARADIYAFGLLLRKMFGPAMPKSVAPIVARATRANPDRRYQLIGDVAAALDRAAADPDAAASDRSHRLLVIAAALVVAAIATAWWLLGGRDALNQSPVKLTSDSGLTTDGAISADGRTMVYASDRTSPGILKLWLQPVSGGAPSWLTEGPDDDRAPSFSPDGSRVAFRSEREGGGIYVVSASGGAAQLLVKSGRDPRFSPDGRWILYWSGDPLQPGNAGIWVVASSGGKPVRLHAEFADARYPVWSADGKSILFVGQPEISRPDWYVAGFENGQTGKTTRTGAQGLLHMQAFRENSDGYYSGAFAVPEAWAAGQVLFSGRLKGVGRPSAGQPRLMRIPISPDLLQATGAAHEITSGADWDSHPSLSAQGRVVFSRRESIAEVWSVAADGSGELKRLTRDTGDVRPALSADGARIAYRVPQPDGKSEIRVADVASGKQVAKIPYEGPREWSVLLSPSGDELVYTGRGVTRVRVPGGRPEPIGRGWGQATSWSADGRYLLVQRGIRALSILDIINGNDRELLRESYPVVESKFSPDDKWIAFTLVSRPHSQVFVAPVQSAGSGRIVVTDENATAGSPAWSPGGNQIYYVTGCQGFRCIWTRRLDARTKEPKGNAFAVRHFHGARYSLVSGIDPQNVGLTAVGDKLVFGLFETTGNIWSLPVLPRP